MFFASNKAFGQSAPQEGLLKASGRIFRLEVASHIDSLELLLDDQLVVLNSTGDRQTKSQYLSRLRSGNFIHNDIKVGDDSAVINGNTGVVTGKGIFTITVSGKLSVIHLAYLETFTRASADADWKLLALHASVIPNPVTNNEHQ